MKMLNFSIIKLTVCLAAGILIGFIFTLDIRMVWQIFGVLFLLFLGAFFRAQKGWRQDAFFGITTYLFFIALGYLTWQLNRPENQKSHFNNTINLASEYAIEGRITEVLKSYGNYHNYVVSVETMNGELRKGKLLLKVKHDTLKPAENPKKLDVDDRIWFSNIVEAIPKPLNPHQFDYAKYMRHQNVLAQSQLLATEIYSKSAKTHTLKGYAHNARSDIVSALKNNGFKDDELGIIKALLLGQKDDISKETYNNYAAAGVIHILAVSGLHVGLVLAILQFLFSPLFRFKHGEFFKMGLIVILLWGFALLAGLSPSVVRAVTMFSFVAIAINLKRRTSTINTLFLSALVLLLINPQFLFTVGFQLSYLAVFSIVLLQPKLSGLIPRPRYWILRLFWGVFTVTLAAQVGVLPLSFFYFHQFPGLFFISNVVIIPVLGVILGFGILTILLALLNLLPSFLADGFKAIISTLNRFVEWVATQESFLFQDIHFSWLQVFGAYVLIGVVLLSLQQFKTKKLIYILMAVVVCQGLFFYEFYFRKTSEEFIVFHQTAETVLGFKTGNHLLLKTSDLQEENDYLNRSLNDYAVGEGIIETETDNLKNIYSLFDNHLLVIDSLGVYSKTLPNDMVLLRNSPKINLNRLIDSLKPKLIIVDGSNYTSYVKRWKETAKLKKLPFHYTREKGAFLIKD